jgi:hypothetical protein
VVRRSFFVPIIFALFCELHCLGQASANSQAQHEIVWGPVTNGLRAGVGFIRRSTRDELQGSCLDFYLATSETNVVRLGLPPRDERFLLQLTDTRNKEVAKTFAGRAFGQPLRKAAKLRDLPGRRNWNFVTPPPSPPTSFGSMKTLELFKVPKTGDYNLSGAILIFRVDDKDQLTPVKLPFSATIPIEVEDK